MTESLISSLGQHSPQAISPLSSVRRYAALDQDPIAAGRELGVDTVLDGSLQRRGDRLRVSVRLLRVADARQLWAQTFDQDFTTIFDVQDIIAARVAQAVSVRWIGSARHAALRTRRIPKRMRSMRVDDSPGRGRPNRACCRQSTSSSKPLRGIRVTRSRTPALQIATLCSASSACALRMRCFPRRAVLPKRRCRSIPISRRRIRHWDTSRCSTSTIGTVQLASMQRALQLDPSLASTYHRRGLLYAMQGDIDRALAGIGTGATARAALARARAAAGNFLYYAKRYDESIRLVEQVLALDERADNARAFLIRNLIVKGEYDRAIAENDKRPIQTPGSNAYRAQALALSGRRAEALAELDRVLEMSKERYVAGVRHRIDLRGSRRHRECVPVAGARHGGSIDADQLPRAGSDVRHVASPTRGRLARSAHRDLSSRFAG